MSERSRGRERSEQSGASERVSGASERANGRASGPVLLSVFLAVIDHSEAVRSEKGEREKREKEVTQSEKQTSTTPKKSSSFYLCLSCAASHNALFMFFSCHDNLYHSNPTHERVNTQKTSRKYQKHSSFYATTIELNHQEVNKLQKK